VLRAFAWCLCAFLAWSGAAGAEQNLIAQQSIEVKASPKAVWSLVKNFNGLHKWHPGFKDDVIKSGRNNMKGAVRTLTLSSGESFDEQLLAFDDKKMLLKYKIIGDSPFPITNYLSTLYVSKAKGGGTKVIWQGTFNNKPGSGKTDDEVVEMLNGAYKAGLDNLKAMVEKK
jgi:mxaD protein